MKHRASGHPADTPDADGIHQALLSGLLSPHRAARGAREGAAGERRPSASTSAPAARGSRSSPAAALHGKQPAVPDGRRARRDLRLWARQNAAIKPEWAERLGAHLVKRTYSEPHWSKKRAAVMAYERVTLYGVPLVADRLVAYGTVDPRADAASCSSGTRWSTASGRTRHRFYGENLRLLEEAEELEHRARRRDIVVDEHTLFDFYDARVGAEVVSGAHFDQWWKQERRQRSPTCSPSTRRCSPTTRPRRSRADDYPDAVAGRGADLPDQLPLRAGRRRRRPHHRRPGRHPQPGRRRRLLLERARACARSWSPA